MTCNSQQIQVRYVNLYLPACVHLSNTAGLPERLCVQLLLKSLLHLFMSVSSALTFLSAEGVSALKAAADTCKAATAFAKHDIANAVTEWWTQPAVNAVPWVKCKSTWCMQFAT